MIKEKIYLGTYIFLDIMKAFDLIYCVLLIKLKTFIGPYIFWRWFKSFFNLLDFILLNVNLVYFISN